MTDERTCIRRVSGEGEAQQIRAFLNAHDLPCELLGEALRKTHGLTIDGLGEVEVHVAPRHVDEALKLLARVDAGEMQIEDWAETDGDAP